MFAIFKGIHVRIGQFLPKYFVICLAFDWWHCNSSSLGVLLEADTVVRRRSIGGAKLSAEPPRRIRYDAEIAHLSSQN